MKYFKIKKYKEIDLKGKSQNKNSIFTKTNNMPHNTEIKDKDQKKEASKINTPPQT